MLYQELHQHFGSHIARRIQLELSASEFKQVVLEDLTEYLEQRAEEAHKAYQTRLDNPFINEELGKARAQYIDTLYHRWREAEDLAYLVSVAKDVGAATRLMVANGNN